jgi:hypothetical protein
MQFKLPTKKLKLNQIFRISNLPDYQVTYGDIVSEGVDKIIKEVEEIYLKCDNSESDTEKNPTKEQLEELSTYLIKFVKDIDEYFKYKNFFRYEWYYPIKYKITFKLNTKI